MNSGRKKAADSASKTHGLAVRDTLKHLIGQAWRLAVAIGFIVAASTHYANADELADSYFEKISQLANGLADSTDRGSQRELASRHSDMLKDGEHGSAILLAYEQSFGAPSPELRQTWRELALLLDQRFADATPVEQRRAETYFGNVQNLWTAERVADFDAGRAKLGRPTNLNDRQLRVRLDQTQHAIDAWREMLQSKDAGKYGNAFQAIKSINSEIVSPDRLAAVRGELLTAGEDTLNQLIAEAEDRIFSCHTASQVDSVLAWIRGYDITAMAPYNSANYSHANRLAQVAERWQTALHSEQQGDLPQIITETAWLAHTEIAPRHRLRMIDMRRNTQLMLDEPLNLLLDEAHLRFAGIRYEYELADAMRWLQRQHSLNSLSEQSTRYREADLLRKLKQAWNKTEGSPSSRLKRSLSEIGGLHRTATVPRSIAMLREALPVCNRTRIDRLLVEATRHVTASDTPAEARRNIAWLLAQNLPERVSPDSPDTFQQLDAMARLAKHWQEFFDFVESGNQAGSESRLKQIRELLEESDLGQLFKQGGFQIAVAEYERQGQLELAAIVQAVDSGIASANRGEGLGRLLNALQPLDSQYRGDRALLKELTELENQILLLENFNRQRDSAKVSFYRNVRLQNPPIRWASWVRCYYAQLIAEACGRSGYLDFTPERSETLRQAIVRVADEAFAIEDWERLRRALQTYETCIDSSDWLDNEIRGCQQFLLGSEAEKRGAIETARGYYEAVLECHGTRVPHEAAIVRLKKLNKVND